MKNVVKSKWFLILLVSIFLISFGTKQANACEIEFEVTDNKKDTYEVGDVIVVKVIVTLTHRSCPVGIKKTKFNMKGLKVVGAKEWNQKSTMVWERELKMKVTGTKDGKLTLNAVRECDKDGGYGSMILESIPVKK